MTNKLSGHTAAYKPEQRAMKCSSRQRKALFLHTCLHSDPDGAEPVFRLRSEAVLFWVDCKTSAWWLEKKQGTSMIKLYSVHNPARRLTYGRHGCQLLSQVPAVQSQLQLRSSRSNTSMVPAAQSNEESTRFAPGFNAVLMHSFTMYLTHRCTV
jgi:hypothetical protein